MATQRRKLSYLSYIEAPGEQRPAMATVDAIGLYQDFIVHSIPVPSEVLTEATRQAQEGCPEGHVCILENYLGRLRVVTIKK